MASKHRSTRLTVAMLHAMADALSEHEAGGWIALTQNLPANEQEKFVVDADKARDWIAEQLNKRSAKKGGR